MAGYFRLKKFSRVFLAASAVCTINQRGADQPGAPAPQPNNVFSPSTSQSFRKKQGMFAKLTLYLEQYMNDNDLQGLSVAVSCSGDLKYVFGRGLQDHNLEVQATPDMVSSVSCISKVFLAYIILKKRENFQIAFDQNMQHYINNFPISRVANRNARRFNQPLQPRIPQDNEHPIFHPGHTDEHRFEYDTIAERAAVENEARIFYILDGTLHPQSILHLLFERSGLKPYHLWSEKNPQANQRTLAQYARELATYPNLHEPPQPLAPPGGFRFNYDDDFSYEFLAYLIETVTGRDYKDVVHDELLMLGLRDTKILSQEELYLNKNRGSQCDENKNIRTQIATFVDYSSKLGAEGLCSTVKDLDKLFNILFVCLATPFARVAALPLTQDSMRNFFLAVGNIQFNTGHTHVANTNFLGNIDRNRGMGLTSDSKAVTDTDYQDGTLFLSIWAKGFAMESSSISMITTKVNDYISVFDNYLDVPANVNTSLVDNQRAFDNNQRYGPAQLPGQPPAAGVEGTLRDDDSMPRQRDVPILPVATVRNPDRRQEFLGEFEDKEHVLEDYKPFGNEFLLRNTDLNFNWKYTTVSIICADRDKDMYNLACYITSEFEDDYFLDP